MIFWSFNQKWLKKIKTDWLYSKLDRNCHGQLDLVIEIRIRPKSAGLKSESSTIQFVTPNGISLNHSKDDNNKMRIKSESREIWKWE